MVALAQRLFAPKRLGPSYPTLPVIDDGGQTNIPGIYAAGELAGTPLVRLGLNAGHDLIERLAAELQGDSSSDSDVLDVLIVGSGSSGLAASVAAKDKGLSYLTLEAAAFANTFVTMTKGKLLLAEPVDVPLRSRVWFEECHKEELLERWRAIRDDEDLNIREQEKVTSIKGQKGDFQVVTPEATYRCKRVLLCLGKAGNPRKLGVPGEKANADRIHHRLLDPDDHVDQDILIVGAGDVACEGAIALCEGGNRVTLSAIDKEFVYPKQRNIDRVRALEAEGKLRILLGSSVREFTESAAVVVQGEQELEIRYDHVFEMIGAELPIRFLRGAGIQLNTDWPRSRWVKMAALFVAVYSLYGLKSYGKPYTGFPFNQLIDEHTYKAALLGLFKVAYSPFAWLFSDAALADIYADKGFQQGYLYSGMYTIVMAVFGYQALMRWRTKASNPRYQTWRFATLIGFQTTFFLLVNVIGVQALSAKYAWRAWGLYQPFPLFFNTFFWWYEGDPGWIFWTFFLAGIFGTFVAIPLAARNNGKRFCTWVCGCGGLAETLGDRWRHLAAKGDRSRAWEFQGVVILAAAFLIGFVIVGMYETDAGRTPLWAIYNYIVDFWLVAVIPITLYPFFGGKVWCRYWCPLAAYNGLLSKLYGTLKITSNSKCITCAECSKYCQVGIDVMAFAKNQQPFDNSNSACIHCGICIDVCPMDVLQFENSNISAVKLIELGKPSGKAA